MPGGSEDDPLDDSMSLVASDSEDWAGSMNDPSLLPSLEPIVARNTKLLYVLSKAVEELGLEWTPPDEPTRLDEWFLLGRCQVPRQQTAPFFPEVHDELTKSWRLCTSNSSTLTTVDSADEKVYERLPPLDEGHLSIQALQNDDSTCWTYLHHCRQGT